MLKFIKKGRIDLRTEEIEKEAALFDREDECYIHVQRCAGGPFAVVASGDPKVIFQAIYTLLCILDSEYKVPFRQAIKMLRRGRHHMLKQERPESLAA